MEPRFEEIKAINVLTYDQIGALPIHYTSGFFRRPHSPAVKQKVTRAGTVNQGILEASQVRVRMAYGKACREGAEEAAEPEEEVDPRAEDDLEDETTDEDDDWQVTHRAHQARCTSANERPRK